MVTEATSMSTAISIAPTLLPPAAPRLPGPTGLRIPASAATLDGFRDWFASPSFPDGVHASLIRGELVLEPSTEDLLTHNQVKTIVAAVLARLVEEADAGYFCGDGMLLSNAAAGISTVPDAVFAGYTSIESGRVRIATIGEGTALVEWQGTPDWVLEIVSDSSVQKDTRDLFDGYARAGIPEYWIIDARGEAIDFRAYRLADGTYAATAPVDGWIASPLFQRRFRLTRELNRLRMWRYRMLVEASPEPPHP
jgi:Uma2 family endonuclease